MLPEEESTYQSSGAGLQKNHTNVGISIKNFFNTNLWVVFNFIVKQSHLTTKMDKKPKVIFSDCDDLIC